MTAHGSDAESAFQDEEHLRWGFLDQERDACAVVSQRMELVYINRAGQGLVPREWFGKRCFEVLPVVNEKCAWHCPTIKAVAESPGIVYCEELIHTADEPALAFGVAVIPVPQTGEDPARAVLLLRRKDAGVDEGAFQHSLLQEGARTLLRIVSQIS
ncbi:MAG: hypothetical protein GWN84_02550 [Gammaproteobacteria bacterium]|nr:hypothetical protein [Gammaproteobacteria bacterium]NIR82032.1 hypothetical protein [Gammaproteobacteria bacterium]NIR89260.1 hypothetical protein [Gammaproteobacteria bacterium]NIU03142.1 hypothetical protein [Gammaproteobacteria bacterium]NIV50658.1 hypothetical protein [Gammaproteobacteria bacterium]